MIVVRDRTGALNGHVNVCRHRLHPVAEGTGCKQLFQCRYHGWTYTHDGSLRSAPGLHNEDAFDRKTLGLRPIAVDTYMGFVFANPDIEARSLHEFIGEAHELVNELDIDFSDWEFAGSYSYDIAANWKLFTENALECYHCPTVHQNTYATVFETKQADYICNEYKNVAVQRARVTELTERLAKRQSMNGFRLLYLWPVTFVSVDDFIGIVARTVPMGSHGSQFLVDTFVKPGTDPSVLAEWLDVYDRTFEEDKAVVAAQQAGYDSGAIPQGRLMSNCESTIAMFQRRTWAAISEDHDLPPGATATAVVTPSEHIAGPTSGTVEATAPRENAEWEADLVVEDLVVEADGVVSLTFASPDLLPLPQWQPGAHVDLCLTEHLTRQYSLCGDPGDRYRWRVAVLRDNVSRGGSRYVHDNIGVGSIVRVRGPRNHFRMPEADSYAFVAGGIGITPIMPMIEVAVRLGKPWKLLYGGRTRSSMAFLSRLATFADNAVVSPQDTDGLLDLDKFVAACVPGTAIMACGPAPLLEAVSNVCRQVDHIALHLERFSASTSDDGSTTADTSFTVELFRTGVTLDVAVDTSILDVVRANGVSVLSSCREGICGTCETRVLEGAPDHRDSVLSEDERASGETLMICVSRCASGRLVLDL